MKLHTLVFLALILVFTMQIHGQDNTSTPEYEATRQTEKIQQELSLTNEQVKLVYEINLKYARARQRSSTRSEAMERVKNKDADLERVLNNEQINKLRNKRYERSVYQPVQNNNFRKSESSPRVNPPVQRSTYPEMRTRETDQRQTQTRPTNETRRTTSEPSRKQPEIPARNERTVRTSERPQTSVPASRQQSTTYETRRNEPTSPNRSEQTVRPSERPQTTAPASRSQNSTPVQRSEVPDQKPRQTTETPRR